MCHEILRIVEYQFFFLLLVFEIVLTSKIKNAEFFEILHAQVPPTRLIDTIYCFKYERRSQAVKLASARARCLARNILNSPHVESNRRENRSCSDATDESFLERCNADYAARSCDATAPAWQSAVYDDLRFRGS